MPQVDLETLVSVCGGSSASERKISCITLATDSNSNTAASDSPPHSFYLSKDAEQEWLHQNAFIQRKHSLKRNPNTPCALRFSLACKSKASILGLPKPQKRTFVETKKNSKPVTARLFPKRSGSRKLAEPGSPKVSCMGRVRSKKDKMRKTQESQLKGTDRQGFLSGLRSIFRVGCTQGSATEIVGSPVRERARRTELRDAPRRSAGEVPGLGGMKRFASGRKSDSWVDADMARL